MAKEYVIKNLSGILGIVNVNVVNHVMLENIKNCKCRNKLVEKYSENIDGNEMIYNHNFNAILINICRNVFSSFILHYIICHISHNKRKH